MCEPIPGSCEDCQECSYFAWEIENCATPEEKDLLQFFLDMHKEREHGIAPNILDLPRLMPTGPGRFGLN